MGRYPTTEISRANTEHRGMTFRDRLLITSFVLAVACGEWFLVWQGFR